MFSTPFGPVALLLNYAHTPIPPVSPLRWEPRPTRIPDAGGYQESLLTTPGGILSSRPELPAICSFGMQKLNDSTNDGSANTDDANTGADNTRSRKGHCNSLANSIQDRNMRDRKTPVPESGIR
jgi:hypothetical protein